MTQSLSYCGALVKTHDRDRFLLSMFAPATSREALWTLFAFNHEIAKTRETVSEPQLGLIRLQWWREALAGIYAGAEAPAHEILQPLAQAIKDYDLKQEDFETLLHAREFDLADEGPENLEGLLNYADFTSTPLLRMAVRIAGGEADMEPVQPVAVNYALAGILRAIPYYSGLGRCFMPDGLMKKQGVSIYSLSKNSGREIVREVADAFVPGVRPDLPFLRATQALAGLYLRQIRKNKYNVFSSKMAVSPAFKELRLVISAWTGESALW